MSIHFTRVVFLVVTAAHIFAFSLLSLCLHEILSDWSGILTKNIAGSSGIE
jgi:hypothetical protein